jgi:hypothetical protein
MEEKLLAATLDVGNRGARKVDGGGKTRLAEPFLPSKVTDAPTGLGVERCRCGVKLCHLLDL